MKMDPFQISAIVEMQGKLIGFLEADPTDIAVKIAALRAAADLMSGALSQAALSASLANFLGGKR